MGHAPPRSSGCCERRSVMLTRAGQDRGAYWYHDPMVRCRDRGEPDWTRAFTFIPTDRFDFEPRSKRRSLSPSDLPDSGRSPGKLEDLDQIRTHSQSSSRRELLVIQSSTVLAQCAVNACCYPYRSYWLGYPKSPLHPGVQSELSMSIGTHPYRRNNREVYNLSAVSKMHGWIINSTTHGLETS